MRKVWLASVLFSAALLAACGEEEAINETTVDNGELETTVEEKIIQDQLGRDVTINGTERIVTSGVLPYHSAWYFSTGSAKEVVGMHPNSYSATENSVLAKIAPELLNASTAFVQNGDMNMEELMNIHPDIFFEIATDEATIDQAEKLGIPTVAVKTFNQAGAEPLATFKSWLQLNADITGLSERKNAFLEEGTAAQDLINERIANVAEADKPKILFLYAASESQLTVTGANFFGEQWINATGGIDVVGESGVNGRKDVNIEQIYDWNPDIIYITNFTSAQPDDLYNNAIGSFDWSDIAAVQNNRVHKVPLGIYRWYAPSGDAPLMLKWMAQHNYPTLFNDYTMEQELQAYYSKMYDYTLTAEEVETILHPASEAAKVTK